MANALKQHGAQSATFVCYPVTVNDQPQAGTLTAADWAQLPAGKLKDLLTTHYMTIGEFMDAYAAAGGSTVATLLDRSVMDRATDEWALNAGYPELTINNGAYQFAVRVETSYSASE